MNLLDYQRPDRSLPCCEGSETPLPCAPAFQAVPQPWPLGIGQQWTRSENNGKRVLSRQPHYTIMYTVTIIVLCIRKGTRHLHSHVVPNLEDLVSAQVLHTKGRATWDTCSQESEVVHVFYNNTTCPMHMHALPHKVTHYTCTVSKQCCVHN